MPRDVARAFITKERFTVLTKTAGLITNGGFLECITFAQCTVYNTRWRNNALQTMLSILSSTTWHHIIVFLPCTRTSGSPRDKNINNNLLTVLWRLKLGFLYTIWLQGSSVAALGVMNQWASLNVLTVVSKFKPHLPEQWTFGTHRKSSSRMKT